MRLWHYKLIPVLPRKQLLSQWRECCAIASNIANKGTPNHILVNKVLEYSPLHFITYTNEILNEMHKRSYRVNERSYITFVNNMNKAKDRFYNSEGGMVIKHQLFPGWHNDRYLTQCFCNLQEKYDCGMFTDDEWELISDQYYKIINGSYETNVRTHEYDTDINKDLGILGSI